MGRIPTCLVVCAVLFPATAAQADVVTYWNDVVAQALTRAVPARPGASGLRDFAAVHIAMHDAIQAFQGRYETYAGAIPNASGSPRAQWTCNGGDNQTWSLQSAPDGYARLIARHSGKCLDVSGVSTSDSAGIIQWPCHGGENQQWRVHAVPGGYQLEARHSGKCLDVTGESTNDGGSVIQWSCHGGANQKWLVRPVTTAPVAQPQRGSQR